jgi:hypothetical protein
MGFKCLTLHFLLTNRLNLKSKIPTHILRELIENLMQLKKFLITPYRGSPSQLKTFQN